MDVGNKVDVALSEAHEAFWAAVAECFPEVTSGDFPPEAQVRLEAYMRSAINLWLRYNHPDQKGS